MIRISILAAVLLASSAAAQTLVPAGIDDADVGTWLDALTPPPAELVWLEVDWVPSFGAGVRRARLENKPLLFWAMNGHPLGCT